MWDPFIYEDLVFLDVGSEIWEQGHHDVLGDEPYYLPHRPGESQDDWIDQWCGEPKRQKVVEATQVPRVGGVDAPVSSRINTRPGCELVDSPFMHFHEYAVPSQVGTMVSVGCAVVSTGGWAR